MLIDLHLHTNRYSACATSSPEEVLAAARACGLDGVVLTEHHRVWPEGEIRELRAAFPELRIFRAVEITTVEGEDVLVYLPDIADLPTERSSVGELIGQVRRSGGAAILAHPLRYRDTIAETLYANPPDACEAWSLNIFSYQRPGIHAFSERTGCGEVAATDSHAASGIGLYAVRFSSAIGDEADLVAALRARDYTPMQDLRRLQEMDAALSRRAVLARQGIAEGLDTPAIRARIGGSLSFIDHLRAGRIPTMRDPGAEDAAPAPPGLVPIVPSV